jgi:hypothetical protein
MLQQLGLVFLLFPWLTIRSKSFLQALTSGDAFSNFEKPSLTSIKNKAVFGPMPGTDVNKLNCC